MDRSSCLLNVMAASCLWLAFACDLAWPVCTQLELQPSFLDLTLVIASYFCMPRMIVFWAGTTGLLTTIVHGEPVQFCVPAYAAVGLLVALRVRHSAKESTFSARLFRSVWMLGALGLLRVALRDGVPTTELPTVSMNQLAGFALTFLMAVMVCVALVSIRRRDAWLE